MKEDDRPLDLRIKREWNLSRTGSIETDLGGKDSEKECCNIMYPCNNESNTLKSTSKEVTTLKKNNYYYYYFSYVMDESIGFQTQDSQA